MTFFSVLEELAKCFKCFKLFSTFFEEVPNIPELCDILTLVTIAIRFRFDVIKLIKLSFSNCIGIERHSTRSRIVVVTTELFVSNTAHL